MKLIRLELRNFKGVRDFVLSPEGGDISVCGDNATGKTTLADAFMWLLFDKDSANRKDFDIKTLDAAGRPISGLEHEVAATLEDERGERVTLRKAFCEKWTKKRGSATKEFTGHETQHHLDGVPVTQAEYRARVAAIADEDTFRLLTDPLQFPERLHWQKRREILLAVCGDVPDADVIRSDRELADLPAILGNRSIEDERRVVAAAKRQVNEELQKIPVRIDEVQRGLPELPQDPDAIAAELTGLRSARADVEAEKVRVQSGGEVAVKERRLREIEGELLAIRHRAQRAADDAGAEDRALLRDLEESADDAGRKARAEASEVAALVQERARAEERMAILRADWQRIDAQQFDAGALEDACPACGQPLPSERVEAARTEALAAFRGRQAERLSYIQAEGKGLQGRVADIAAEIAEHEPKAGALEQAAAAFERDAASLRSRLAERAAPDPSGLPAWKALVAEQAQLQREVAGLQDGNLEALAALANQLSALNRRIADAEARSAACIRREQGLARIEALKADERRLASEYERLERETFLMERFTRAKVAMLEDRINGRFAIARFRLFEQQVNGGLSECCDVTCGGVPYGSLNHGARLNVGLDCINTLADHYGFAPPVWVDNAESVTAILPTRGQQVRLVVSEPDKTLRVEVGRRVKEALAS